MSCCCPYECECNRVVAPLPTTTTTTTLCPNAIICDEAVLMDCVIYSGCDSLCPQLETGDSLVTVFGKMFDMYENCNGPLVPGTTTTTTTHGPVTLVLICLSYAATGGCAAACPRDCQSYYTSSACANKINTNAAPGALGCVLYLDPLGTTPAPDGFYSRPGGLCYILGSSYNSGIITGITNCPVQPVAPTTLPPCKCYNVFFSDAIFPQVPITYIPCGGGSSITTLIGGQYCISSIVNQGTAIVNPITSITSCTSNADCIPPTTTRAPIPNLNPECSTITYNITAVGTSFVANGVTVSVSSTQPTRTGVGAGQFNYASCLPPWNPTTLYIGASGFNMGYTTGDFTLTFSRPVNNVKIKLVNYGALYQLSPFTHAFLGQNFPHLEAQEEYTFTVGSGRIPTIDPCDYCFATISGNKLTGLIDLPNGIDISNGSAIVEIIDTIPYTSLRIDGALLGYNCLNESLGTFFQLGDFTII